ncbi:MAG: Crp/Fnr family transcriptional regulator [Acidobacteriia bacterium]|nr:Crp/Fnr family transcriptional regulator [Terriglobia bacterium]
MSNYGRDEVIFRESTLTNEAHVLITGIARITCLNVEKQRVTVALIAPGPIPSLLTSRFDFRCEAYNECRVGALDWKGFNRVTVNGSETVLREFHQNDLKYCSRLLRHISGLLNHLHQRIALTMLDLCEDFGTEDSRGALLPVSFSHKEIASIAGASRPRVTEHLAQMERDHLLLRQGRRFIVDTAKLSASLASDSLIRTELDRTERRRAQKRVAAASSGVRSAPWSKESNGRNEARPGLS